MFKKRIAPLLHLCGPLASKTAESQTGCAASRFMNECSCGRTPMSSKIDPRLGRRGFLTGVVAAAGAAPVARQSLVVTGLAGATVVAENRLGRAQTTSGIGVANLPAPEAGYQSLSPDEAGFVEAMVNIMCPADGLTPSGVGCGLANYIHPHLAP